MSAYDTAVVNDGAVAYWKLNEAAGSTTAADSIGANTLTIGGSHPSGGDFGGANLLNANSPDTSFSVATIVNYPNNAYLSVGSVGSLVTDTNGQSVEAWFKPGGDYSYVLVQAYSGTPDSYDRYQPDSKAYASQFRTSRIDVFATMPSTGTHHWVVTRKTGGHYIWYLDGASIGDSATPGTFSWPATFLIGQAESKSHKGLISNVALYNTQLSAAQVLDHYNKGIASSGGAKMEPTGILRSW